MSYVIYKICSDDCPNFIYVGSTKNFTNRKYTHKFKYIRGYNFTLYNKIKEYGGWDNWRMVIVEELGNVNLTQSRIKEEEWREKIGNLNMKRCHATDEQLKEYDKKYHETHKQKRNEYSKKYNETHKQKMNENNKKYREENKQKIKARKSEKIECECGSIFRRDDIRRHELSKKHFNFINFKEKIDLKD